MTCYSNTEVIVVKSVWIYDKTDPIWVNMRGIEWHLFNVQMIIPSCPENKEIEVWYWAAGDRNNKYVKSNLIYKSDCQWEKGLILHINQKGHNIS